MEKNMGKKYGKKIFANFAMNYCKKSGIDQHFH